MKEFTMQGKYVRKSTGEVITFDVVYPVFNSVEDCINSIGEDKALSLINRMVKTDARNQESARVQAENGDLTRKVVSEEEKALRKEQRQADKDLLAKLKANPELLASLGL